MGTGRIFEIKPFAVHDGPGIRTTVFFKGCPLRCIWCHNPEGIDPEPEVAFLQRKCVQCGECRTICPTGLDGTCTLCGACAAACMPQARLLYGTEYTADELFRRVLADSDFYKASGGGITCSGGEPLMQAEFLAEFLSLCKRAGLHTAVDTSGAVPWDKFEQILPHTDLFLYDIKHMDTQEHRQLTGVGNKRILENLQRLCDRGAPVEVRIPVIPGLNDGDDNLRQMAAYFSTLKTLTAIIPLPYHALSGSKYASIGKKSPMPEATGEEYAAAQRVSDFFR